MGHFKSMVKAPLKTTGKRKLPFAVPLSVKSLTGSHILYSALRDKGFRVAETHLTSDGD